MSENKFGYIPDSSNIDSESLKKKQEITSKFLKGASKRFSDICPETLVMIDLLNHKQRPISDIEANLDENDKFYFKVLARMRNLRITPEENMDLDLNDLGLKHIVFKNLKEIIFHGNALFIELIISQFSYYVDKLDKLNCKSFDELLEKRLSDHD